LISSVVLVTLACTSSAGEFLGLRKALRGRWPGEKLYVVCDIFSPHHHPASAPGAPPTR
jgi:hypothetical protein